MRLLSLIFLTPRISLPLLAGNGVLHIPSSSQAVRTHVLERSRMKVSGPHPEVGLDHMLARHKLDFPALLCEEYNGWDDHGRLWKHYFMKAACDVKSNNPRQVKLTCGSQYRKNVLDKIWSVDDLVLSPLCPERTICQAIFLPQSQRSGSR